MECHFAVDEFGPLAIIKLALPFVVLVEIVLVNVIKASVPAAVESVLTEGEIKSSVPSGSVLSVIFILGAVPEAENL